MLEREYSDFDERKYGDFQWDRCDCCGGDLPTINGDNDHPDFPELESEGECPGWITDHGLCGAYSGWTPKEIIDYLRDAGYDV
jgi:hypothetical protein